MYYSYIINALNKDVKIYTVPYYRLKKFRKIARVFIIDMYYDQGAKANNFFREPEPVHLFQHQRFKIVISMYV